MAANINPQFENVGRQFVQHYYQTFDTNRTGLAALYQEQSMMSFEGDQFVGAASIVQKLGALPFKTVQHTIVSQDYQPNPTNGGVICFVNGTLVVDNGVDTPLKFAQIFQLVQINGANWTCINDMFRLNIG